MITETENGSKNNHNFIINGRVKFIPFRRIIEDMNTGTKIKLHVPASLCLDRLLNNQGRLVSQDELILYAWGLKRESTVSSNTFYQCILHLRRKLAQLELCDVIETVPRHGIIFNNSVSVLITQDTPRYFNSTMRAIKHQKTQRKRILSYYCLLKSTENRLPMKCLHRFLPKKVLIQASRQRFGWWKKIDYE